VLDLLPVFNLIFSGVSLFAEAIVRERAFTTPAPSACDGTLRWRPGRNFVGGWLAGAGSRKTDAVGWDRDGGALDPAVANSQSASSRTR